MRRFINLPIPIRITSYVLLSLLLLRFAAAVVEHLLEELELCAGEGEDG